MIFDESIFAEADVLTLPDLDDEELLLVVDLTKKRLAKTVNKAKKLVLIIFFKETL